MKAAAGGHRVIRQDVFESTASRAPAGNPYGNDARPARRRSGVAESLLNPSERTGDQVIVHHARRLHEGVDDRRADEPEPQALQIPADALGQRGPGRNLARLAPRVDQGREVHVAPQEVVQRQLPDRKSVV